MNFTGMNSYHTHTHTHTHTLNPVLGKLQATHNLKVVKFTVKPFLCDKLL